MGFFKPPIPLVWNDWSEGCISDESAEKIASGTGLSPFDVGQTASFYHFFTKKPAGKYAVYLNNSAVARMSGSGAVAKAFEEEANCRFGSVSKGGLIGLYETSDIGMNDQEPAAFITGYEPIKNSKGEIIGILYVGSLEKPFRDMERNLLLALLVIIGLSVFIFTIPLEQANGQSAV